METRGPRILSRDFSPGFSVNNMYKDLLAVMKLWPMCGSLEKDNTQHRV